MQNEENNLHGKVAIVTGASSGIGRATARLLATRGCRVVLAARSADKLRALAEEIGSNAFDVPADMTKPEDIARMVSQTLKRFGSIDIPWEPVYSATKHAVTGFVHTLRRQVAASGIRVGSVSPGVVLNEIWGITDPAEVERRVAEKSGIRSEDVARAVAYMLSEPRHVTIRDLVILPQAQDI